MQLDVVVPIYCFTFSQVKQIMEEAVTKKFIHEDSASVTTLCGKYIYLYKIVDYPTSKLSQLPNQ